MDRSTNYRHVIKELLAEEAQQRPSHGNIDVVTLSDVDQQNFQLLYVGWDRPGRVYTVILHLRLHDDKIWVERDGTEEGVTFLLIEKGIPREDIVLAFRSPEIHRHSDFVVA